MNAWMQAHVTQLAIFAVGFAADRWLKALESVPGIRRRKQSKTA
jgi:hypothetical protein